MGFRSGPDFATNGGPQEVPLPAYSRHRRGFTLIEVMTAVVIIIILAALAVSYMVYGMGKVRMNNAVFDATAMINGAQLRALSHGAPHYVLIYQDSGTNRVHLQVLERPDTGPTPDWTTLDLKPPKTSSQALAYTHTKPDGTPEILDAPIRDQLALGDGAGASSSGLAFLDLDSTRIKKPLPAPFSALSLTTSFDPPEGKDIPTTSLLAGCNFCIVTPGFPPYGLLRFNADGSMQVLTGNAISGAVLAFAPNTTSEQGFTPKLLTISAPAGATVIF